MGKRGRETAASGRLQCISNILVARLPFPRGQYQTAAEKQRFFGQLLPRVRAIRGVVEATETSGLPPYGGIGTEIAIPGKVHNDRWDAIYQLVSEGYFRTLGARLVRGRWFNESEVTGARKLAAAHGADLCLHELAVVTYPFLALKDETELALGQLRLRLGRQAQIFLSGGSRRLHDDN